MGRLNNEDWEHVDIAAIIAGIDGNGVTSGLAVSESATPAMSVLVASGGCIIDTVVYTESSGQNLNISNGDATHPRKDIIVYDATAGNPAVVEGTPAAAPIPPNIPSGDIYLAMVHVAANETTNIVNADIDEGRVNVRGDHSIDHIVGGTDALRAYISASDIQLHINSSVKSAESISYSQLKETQPALISGTVRVKCSIKSSHNTYNTMYYVNVNDRVSSAHANATTSYIEFSDDIQVNFGDSVTIIARAVNTGVTVSVKDLKICGTLGDDQYTSIS